MWLAILTGISRAMKGPFLEFRDAVLKELTLLVRGDPGVRTLVRHGGLEVAAGVVGSIRKPAHPGVLSQRAIQFSALSFVAQALQAGTPAGGAMSKPG
jgi:hypothetical protein